MKKLFYSLFFSVFLLSASGADQVSLKLAWIKPELNKPARLRILWKNNTENDIRLDPNYAYPSQGIVMIDFHGGGAIPKVPPELATDDTVSNGVLVKAKSTLEIIETVEHITQAPLKDKTFIVYYDYGQFPPSRGSDFYSKRIISNVLLIKKEVSIENK